MKNYTSLKNQLLKNKEIKIHYDKMKDKFILIENAIKKHLKDDGKINSKNTSQ